jgi:putative transposase
MREWQSLSHVRWYCRYHVVFVPKYRKRAIFGNLRIANTVGYVKGKSAIRIHRQFLSRERRFTGFHFWARGYCVSTVGLDEQKIRAYIRDQEEEEKRQEQLPFGGLEPPSAGKRGA